MFLVAQSTLAAINASGFNSRRYMETRDKDTVRIPLFYVFFCAILRWGFGASPW
jgi:hypothetical protein